MKAHKENSTPCNNKKHWLDYAIFGTAFVAAVGGIVAVWFTWSQVQIAEDTAKRQLRAYLSVSVSPNALQNFGEGKTARVQGVIENVGLTPAYKATWVAGLNVAEKTPAFQLAYQGCKTIMKQPDVAEWFIAKQPAFAEKSRPEPITKKEMENIEAGRGAVYFTGRICYLDIYEEVQAIDFCIYWDWDHDQNRVRSNGTYCRHSNGPPEKKTTL